MKEKQYLALLRGINVGGNKMIKMEDLRKAFEGSGYQHVRTLLASGNVIFEAPKTKSEILSKTIEAKLKTEFGHEIGVLLTFA